MMSDVPHRAVQVLAEPLPRGRLHPYAFLEVLGVQADVVQQFADYTVHGPCHGPCRALQERCKDACALREGAPRSSLTMGKHTPDAYLTPT